MLFLRWLTLNKPDVGYSKCNSLKQKGLTVEKSIKRTRRNVRDSISKKALLASKKTIGENEKVNK